MSRKDLAGGALRIWYETYLLWRNHPNPASRRGALFAKTMGPVTHDRIIDGRYRGAA